MNTFPLVGYSNPGDHPQRGGLAAAGGAQQRHHLAVVDVEIDVVHRHKILAGVRLLEDLGDIL